MYRIGQSTDIHRLALNLPLILGGCHIDYDKGCVAHSDGDVLVHAIIEAIIGAMGLGDIGTHFCDQDDINKNRSSLEMLSVINEILLKKAYHIVNIDSIIIIEKPRLQKYIKDMKGNIAKVLLIPDDLINIKATCAETLGFIGQEKGVVAQAVVMVKKNES
ncbi:MAG: 2-C-methyl-D-erythritol 2,4-cyclodiphosphate synthase [Bacilli bacterium]|nr:2-C-methyl-D-erythritol 2,4-cyclodiphosphate synthase [Bacilli bacterium]